MPELPEVETVKRGLAPHLEGRILKAVTVREPRLRWPVPADIHALTQGQRIGSLHRRGKYLLIPLQTGTLLIHLGMSGSLRLTHAGQPPEKHEHFDLLLEDGHAVRYRDPRRFGALLWSSTPASHPLLAPLGIEPLDAGFDAAWLHGACRGCRVPIKHFIMDAHRIVGIGNIYANEALFHAGIHPATPAGDLSRPRCQRLVQAIRDTLERAIAAGGSSLRDFVNGHGQPGYFQQTYAVYGRTGLPCVQCGRPIRLLRQAARATFLCAFCQKR